MTDIIDISTLTTAQERNKYLIDLLWANELEITFTKVNGETRVMPCTLKASVLPPREAKTLHETRVYKPETLSVWCLDKGEWRAMKVMNVTAVKLLNT